MSLPTSLQLSALSFGPHHAYFIEGERESTLREIENFLLEDSGFEVKGNPDYSLLEFENLAVEDARALREMHFGGSLHEGTRRVFVVCFQNATSEAQNTLLKTFEEPNPTSRFFVIAPSVNILLPTLKSRFEIIKTNQRARTFEIDAREFLDSSFGTRLKTVKKMVEKISTETLQKADAIDFLKNLHSELRERVTKGKASPSKLASISKALTYLPDKSSSTKMLLEYVVICL